MNLEKKLTPFISLILVIVLLLTSCNPEAGEPENQQDPEASMPTDEEQEPSLKLYQWSSADKKIELTEESDLVFGDGSYLEPGDIIVKYFSLKNTGNSKQKYSILLEATQPSDAEHKAHSLSDVLKYQFYLDTKFGDAEWNENFWIHQVTCVNDHTYNVVSSKEAPAGEERFFAIAIRMDSDATDDYKGKKLYLDVKLNIFSEDDAPPKFY